MTKVSKSGLTPDGDVRLTANIAQSLHLKLKLAAIEQHTTIGELIETLVDQLPTQGRAGFATLIIGGQVCLIDPENVQTIHAAAPYLFADRDGREYVHCTDPKTKQSTTASRLIMQAPESTWVKYKNGNRLDLRKENLWVKAINRSPIQQSASGWRVRLCVDKSAITRQFSTEADAKAAHELATGHAKLIKAHA